VKKITRAIILLLLISSLISCNTGEIQDNYTYLKRSLGGKNLELESRMSPSGRWLLNNTSIFQKNNLPFPLWIIDIKDHKRYKIKIPIEDGGNCELGSFSPDEKKVIFACQTKFYGTPQVEYHIIVSGLGDGIPIYSKNKDIPVTDWRDFEVHWDNVSSDYFIDTSDQTYIYTKEGQLADVVNKTNLFGEDIPELHEYGFFVNKSIYQVRWDNQGNIRVIKIKPPYNTFQVILKTFGRIAYPPAIDPENKYLLIGIWNENDQISSIMIFNLMTETIDRVINAPKGKEYAYVNYSNDGYVLNQRTIKDYNNYDLTQVFRWDTLQLDNYPVFCNSEVRCLGWKEIYGGYLNVVSGKLELLLPE
jgi:hypothetical protein